MKQCTGKRHIGDRLLPITEFRKNRYSSDGYDTQCKYCRRAYAILNYPKHREHAIEYVSRWQQENKKNVNINSQKYRDIHKDKRAVTTKKWRDKNKQLTCYLANKRRAQKLNATPSWCETELIKELYNKCPDGYHVHHIVPLQDDSNVCGLHCIANLTILSEEDHKLLHQDKKRLTESYVTPCL